jgi:hypothetical protein
MDAGIAAALNDTRALRRLKKYRAHLAEVRSLFAITSPSVPFSAKT